MKDLLILLGKRIHELRVAKEWSQEEFAHVSGLHRTYIGQIERGEKNMSFGNLVKVAAVLGVTAAELLSALEGGRPAAEQKLGRRRDNSPDRQAAEVQKLLGRFKHQRAAMDRTMTALEQLVGAAPTIARPSRASSRMRRTK